MTTRIQRTEAHYRGSMRAALLNLLYILNPKDQIQYGALDYPELVRYADEWLHTELEEVLPESMKMLVPPKFGKMKDLVQADESLPLSLD